MDGPYLVLHLGAALRAWACRLLNAIVGIQRDFLPPGLLLLRDGLANGIEHIASLTRQALEVVGDVDMCQVVGRQS